MDLKRLKKRLEAEEEAIRRLKNRYEHLEDMSQQELLEYLNLRDKKELIAYSNRLFLPIKNSVDTKDINRCNCCDSNGIYKNLYSSYTQAKRALEYMSIKRLIELKIYPCPTSSGWHLSKI